MYATIIRKNKTVQEAWQFEIHFDRNKPQIILEHYSKDEKHERQRKYRNKLHWQRIDKRDNNIEVPPLPDDVSREVKEYFVNLVNNLPITVAMLNNIINIFSA